MEDLFNIDSIPLRQLSTGEKAQLVHFHDAIPAN
jgi:hypothetical protein